MDGHGRQIGDLRVSVTDRCNLRCKYCMPEHQSDWLPREDTLRYEEITRLVDIMSQMGVHDIRLTGGEPLMRRDLPTLVKQLSVLKHVTDLSLTTNGVLLEDKIDELADAGLRRVNVSLDSLHPERFIEITRRRGFDRVMASLDALQQSGRLDPVKVNVVAIKGFTEAEVLGFAELARTRPFIVRFIEFMPLDADRAWRDVDVLTGEEVRSIIASAYELEPVDRETSATSIRWRFADSPGEVGFINPVSTPFCSDCNRVRLTADGKLRTCLFSIRETDLLTPLRAGATDDDVAQIIRDAVWRKELKHRIGDKGFVQPPRTMSAIGG
jgi:cyclic pyranopterin phosphate synthase